MAKSVNASDSNYPKKRSRRYRVIRELGHNKAGGRVTYLATDTTTGQSVVIKQFQFAQSDSNWSGFKSYEREIQVMRSLNHSRIPRYLNSFETSKGLCLVQEYKDAQPLAVQRSFNPEQIKEIAICVLDTLVYLQNQIPPIIHRDIKPENLLVDEQLNVYIVDFGFVRIGGGSVAMSSVAAGTFGFMAPEQLYNRELSLATDLYGLGASLICLLTGIKSTAIETLIDEDGRIAFQHLVPQLSLSFIDWLQRMVQPYKKDRYPSAAAALKALQPISVSSIPEVHLDYPHLKFNATKLGQKLTHTFSINKHLPDSVAEGIWEVAPHPNDPLHKLSDHAWISFSPRRFTPEQEKYKITVDTSKLMAAKTYERKILLHATSVPEINYSLTLLTRTAPLPRESDQQLYTFLLWLFLFYCTAAMIFVVDVGWVRILAGGAAVIAGVVFGVRTSRVAVKLASWFGLPVGALLAFVMFYLIYLTRILMWEPLETLSIVLLVVLGAIAAVIVGDKIRPTFKGLFAGTKAENMGVAVSNGSVWQILKREFGTRFAILIPLLTAALGINLGIGFKLGFLFVTCVSLAIGLPLAWMILYLPKERSRLIAKYNKSEQHLIKP